MYSYSESEINTPSPIQHPPVQVIQQEVPNMVVNKIENLMENEQSITFISSKFIKSNSVESIADL